MSAERCRLSTINCRLLFTLLREACAAGEEGNGGAFAGLFWNSGPVDGVIPEAWWGAGFESAPLKGRGEAAEGLGKWDGGAGVTTAIATVVADPNAAAEGGSGGDDDGFSEDLAAVGEDDAAREGVRWGRGGGEEEVCDEAFEEGEGGEGGSNLGEATGVGRLVALDPDGADSGSARGVEGAILEACEVGIEAHFTAEGIEFNDEVGLGESADGGVAGHQAEGVALGGDEEGFAAHPGGGEGGFASGMAGTNDEDIVGSSGSGGHSGGIIPRWETARRSSNHKDVQRYAEKHKGDSG